MNLDGYCANECTNLLLFVGGKRDDKLILPVNDSISGTLSTDQVKKTLKTFLFIPPEPSTCFSFDVCHFL